MHAQPLLYGAAPRSAKHGVAAGKTREDAARQCPHLLTYTTTHAHAHRDLRPVLALPGSSAPAPRVAPRAVPSPLLGSKAKLGTLGREESKAAGCAAPELGAGD